MIQYLFHELAASLPLMREPDFSDFVEDIRINGQFLPIGIFEGKILDGRNRYLACRKLHIEGKFEKVSPKDAKAYVTSLNVHRRQLTREERQHHLMMLIAKQDALEMTNAEVAKAADVSVATVKREKSKKGSNPPHLTPSYDESGKTNDKKRVGQSVQGSKKEIGGSLREADAGGVSIPDAALPYWSRKPEALNVLNQIRAAKGQVKKIDASDPMYCEVNLNGVLSDLRNASNRFAAAIPAHVCPYCKGTKPDDCKACKGRGVVSKYFWDTAVPSEMKPEQPF